MVSIKKPPKRRHKNAPLVINAMKRLELFCEIFLRGEVLSPSFSRGKEFLMAEKFLRGMRFGVSHLFEG